jgi:hypothetical protein
MSTGVGTRLLYNLMGESLKMAHIVDLMIILILRAMFQALWRNLTTWIAYTYDFTKGIDLTRTPSKANKLVFTQLYYHPLDPH